MTTRHDRLLLIAISLTVVVATAVFAVAAGGPELYGNLPAVLLAASDGAPLQLSLLSKAAQGPWPEIRIEVARILAARADPATAPIVNLLAGDRDPRVRAAAMVAAGRLGRPAQGAVTRGLSGASAIERQAAAWAACRSADSDLHRGVLARITEERDPGVLETILANLWRTDLQNGWPARCRQWARHQDPALRRAAAYSLAREQTDEPSAALRKLVADNEPVIRLTALIGMSRRSLSPADVAVAAAALADPDWRVRSAACAVLARTFAGTPPEGTGEALQQALRSEHPHLVVSAMRVLAHHPSWSDAGVLRSRANDESEPWYAEEALRALAARGAESTGEMVVAWSSSDAVWRRVAAMEAVGAVATAGGQRDELFPLIEAALQDSQPIVRLAAVDALATLRDATTLDAVIETDRDPAVRAAALAARQELGALSPERLHALFDSWSGDPEPYARSVALHTLWSTAPESEHTQKVVRAAEHAASPILHAILADHRRASGAAIELQTQARHGHQWYEDLARWREQEHWLDVVTMRGTFRCRLDTDVAPITAREVVTLAKKGSYDGLGFHRVVPNFVVQGGDPRGDGWGSAGLVLPDEPSLVPFDSWRVGIATDGPGTGGSQLFATLVPADHLTGYYTNVAEVVAGTDVLERLRRWDRIIRVEHHAGKVEPLTPTLIGRVSWSDLADLPGWQESYDAFSPNPEVLQRLAALKPHGRALVILGTWCSDSRREVPRFLAVLEALGASASIDVDIYAVDRSKRVQVPGFDDPLLPSCQVDRVATILIADGDGHELGRVVEQPTVSIETALEEMFTSEVAR